MLNEIFTLVRRMPPFTRVYIAGIIATTGLCSIEYVSPYDLYYTPSQVLKEKEIWRILTTFLFFGQQFNLNFIFHLYFVYNYLSGFEKEVFMGNNSDFIMCLLFIGLGCLSIGPLLNLVFLGDSFISAVVYIWCRFNGLLRVAIFGFIETRASVFPFVILLFYFIVGNNLKGELLGILVGHSYYFSYFVYHKLNPRKTELLRAPNAMRNRIG
eukprot:GAHX01000876.1.p1 GENE.GAHX01000876.1~~GAHX01000876.1.p1  ORF type:complete len:212 (+),score=12.73 GAHX01000876.1:35-670(+)